MSVMIQTLLIKTNILKIIYVEDPKTGNIDHTNRLCDNYNEKDR